MIILLDASFYRSDLSSQTVEFISSTNNILVSDTFKFELDENLLILPKKYRDVYRSNISLINRVKKDKNIRFVSLDKNYDFWRLLNAVCEEKKTALVLTGNDLLIDRIILNNLFVDVFDLNTDRYYHFDEFSKEKKLREFSTVYEESPVYDDVFSGFHEEIYKGTLLYTKSGNTVCIGDILNTGTEASIFYLLGVEDYVAKIFKPGKLTFEKYNNIKNLVENEVIKDIDWALFPLEMLYSEEECINPVGYVEKTVCRVKELEVHPLYVNDLSEIVDNNLNYPISFSVDVCISIVRQILFLNSLGIYVSDCNIRNFAMRDDETHRIQMWDTDSFGYLNYFSGYCSGDKTTRNYNTTIKSEAIDFCSEALYILIFKIMTLGDTPLNDNGEFKYNNSNYPYLFRQSFVPESLWGYLSQSFQMNTDFSVELLLKELIYVQQQFENYEIEDKKYYDIILQCLGSSEKSQPYKNGKRFNLILIVLFVLIFATLALLIVCCINPELLDPFLITSNGFADFLTLEAKNGFT